MRVRHATIVGALAIAFSTGTSPGWAGGPSPQYSLDAREHPLKESSRGGFRVGMKVRLKQRARVLKPKESGHKASLAYGPGQTGVIVRFIRRDTADMAIIRWDEQKWFEWDIPMNRMQQGRTYSAADINRMNSENGPAVLLPSFELPAYLETLESVLPADKAAVAKAEDAARARQRALGPPVRTSCAGGSPVPGEYIIFLRAGFDVAKVADELGQKPGVKIKRVWPALQSFSADVSSTSLKLLLSDARLSEVTDNCR